MACGRGASRSRRPHVHVVTSFVRNLGDLIRVRSHAGPAHEGNSRTMGMHADEKSDGCIVPVKPRTMPSEIGGGDGGGTAAGQGEGELQRMHRTQCRNRHVTESASPRIGAAWVPNTPKADRVRPETGARCGKAARRDLRGGRGAILVPTATLSASSADAAPACRPRSGRLAGPYQSP
jgi:hypothetical protein